MEFEKMVGTTGLASAYGSIYIANNGVITISDNYGEMEDIQHNFDFITNMVVSELQLFGIYGKEGKYGIFSIDRLTHFLKVVEVNYTPVNLTYYNNFVFVLDNEYKSYHYEKNMTLRETIDTPPIEFTGSIHFMTIGLTNSENNFYFSKKNEVYDGSLKMLLSVEGEVLSLLYYENNLFVIYNSLYNHYSILQYNLIEKKKVLTIEGGYISGPPIYSCIFGNELYISASTNNIISLDLFEFPEKENDVKIRPRAPYPMFELNKTNQNFITNEVNINTEKIKKLQDYGKVDTTPSKNTLYRYYMWMSILIFILIVALLSSFFKENKIFILILFIILFIYVAFLIKNKIPI